MRARVLVVDSSVVVKWFKPEGEPNLGEALALLKSHTDESCVLAAPTHLRLEVLNALWSHRVAGQDLLDAARDLEDFRLSWFAVDAALSMDAATLATRHKITLYDAAFAALANRLETTLVTEDRQLARSKACDVRLLGG